MKRNGVPHWRGVRGAVAGLSRGLAGVVRTTACISGCLIKSNEHEVSLEGKSHSCLAKLNEHFRYRAATPHKCSALLNKITTGGFPRGNDRSV